MHGPERCRWSLSSFWAAGIIRANSEKGTTSSGSKGSTSTGQLELGYLTRREFRSDLNDVGRRHRDRNCKKREKRFREEFQGQMQEKGTKYQEYEKSASLLRIYREHSNDKRIGMTLKD
jgi:hypothetical protein